MAIFYFINLIVATETIEGGKLFKGGNYSWKYVVVAIIFPLFNENLNSFLTRLRKLFKGGNYSREETIRGHKVLNLIFFLGFEASGMARTTAWLSHIREPHEYCSSGS